MTRPCLARRPGGPFALTLLLFLSLVAALPAGAAAAAVAPVAAVDPVVQEVVRMLDGGVAEPVIDSWLETSGRRPAHVDSGELVALQKAKASADLMKRLIHLANGLANGGAPAAAAPALPAASPPPTAAEPPAASAPAPSAAPVPTPPAASGGVPVRFEIGYRPFTTDESAPVWDLFVYLDGRFLTWIKPAAISLTARTASFDRSLAAGHHVIRLVQERHTRRSGRSWVHEARVAPAALAFDLGAGEPWRVHLQLDQVKISRKGPLTLRVTSGEREVAAATGGGEPETWSPLCEEVEANAAAGRSPSADARRQLGSCVRWDGLWPGVAGVPPRDRVRAELERDRFQPPAP
jgi:hypothetical protein